MASWGQRIDTQRIRGALSFPAFRRKFPPRVALQIGSTIILNSSAITDNTMDGAALQSGSAMSLFARTITNNGGHQIRIGDLSIARFAGFASNIVSGPNYPDVVATRNSPQRGNWRQMQWVPPPTAPPNCHRCRRLGLENVHRSGGQVKDRNVRGIAPADFSGKEIEPKY